MTTEQRATCGLAETAKGSAAGGCRGVGRAEAFARSLHHKLRSLGRAPASTTTTSTSISSASSNGAAGPDSSDDMEDSWSSAPSGPSSLTALRTLSTSSVDSASDMFYDLELVPQSPEEEVTSQELALMMAGSANRDDLLSNGNGPQSPQSDCSSDYFDTDCYEEERRAPPAVTQQSPLDGDATPSNGLAPPLVNGHGLANGSANGNTNGPASGATNGPVNGVANGPAKPKRPWNRVPHRFKAGTPEAMCEVSQRDLDDPDDDDEAAKPCSRKTGLAKLSFPKSSQTLLQEGLIEQLKQGHDIPVELKNGPCPGGTAAEDSCGPPVASSRGLTAMKEKARALDALATPEDETNGLLSDQDTLRLEAADAVINVVVDKDATPTKEADSAANKCRACGRQRVLDECPDCAADERGDLSDGDKADRDDGSRPRVRRCSSLKTGKTPPGTPGRKKIVRFADVLGLDLADVRTFLDEIPKVPTSAYSDLQDVDQSDTLAVAGGCLPSGLPSGLPQLALAFNAVPSTDLPPFGARPVTRVLVPLFQQPGGQADFLDRVRDRQVCLENAVVADVALLSIAGQVRVRNLDFHKTVHLRYTTDGWRSFADLQASYVPNSCDGFSDKFTFTLFAGHTMSVGQRLEIAVRFQCKGQQYWDNNAGANYCFQCLPPSGAAPLMPLPSLHALGSPSDDGWKYLF